LHSLLPADVVPELAEKERFKAGVRAMEITNPAQLDHVTQTTKDIKSTLKV
jgi:hypothetical protein